MSVPTNGNDLGGSAMRGRWTFYHLGGEGSLYVYLCPPGSGTEPRFFALAGLAGHLRKQLAQLKRGDRVPDPIVEALHALCYVPVGRIPDRTSNLSG